MKILIVEDEIRLAEFIKKGLEENTHLVDFAKDGEIGLKMAFENEYDVIILDVNLPKMNGYDITQAIRNEKQNTPILMLTAMGTLNDKAFGYEAGIDDFLVKPFQFQELLMRLNALHRRSSMVQQQVKRSLLKVADLELDLTARNLTRAGKEILLTAKEYALLEYLMINHNRVVSRIDIAEKIWDADLDPASNTIDTYINFLRKKIDKEFTQKLIHTVVGMGYILKA
ncbi:Transcriptional activator protein CzcR [Emticicia aquatica]|jgi:DNA-binding response OmpR family regulator|uniref:Transcriptional activator protein CzcR n=1 Tax=Emticicia aquatica TaxID=1681835 RepID=A0ABM9ANY7_9BACT|nr:response regulator transcription factor [Emticicia aquatica]CAH0995540.1 Transcriptional activator protein CzcR [Emticicia aquatica]